VANDTAYPLEGLVVDGSADKLKGRVVDDNTLEGLVADGNTSTLKVRIVDKNAHTLKGSMANDNTFG